MIIINGIASVTIILALGALFTGLHAAQLWGMAGFSEMVRDSRYNPQDTFVLLGRAQNPGELNGKAARWTALSVLLGSLTSLWSAIAPLVWK